MITIGITGTIGAGKGMVVEYLKTKGITHYSVRNFLVEEINRRGLSPTRETMREVADGFRKISLGYIMEQFLLQQKEHHHDAVIESVRTLAEIETLRKNAENFYLIAVDADPKVRYERILARNSSTDTGMTFEDFVVDEQRAEMSNPEPWKINLKGCIDQADVLIRNEGTIEELYTQVEELFEKLTPTQQINMATA